MTTYQIEVTLHNGQIIVVRSEERAWELAMSNPTSTYVKRLD